MNSRIMSNDWLENSFDCRKTEETTGDDDKNNNKFDKQQSNQISDASKNCFRGDKTNDSNRKQNLCEKKNQHADDKNNLKNDAAINFSVDRILDNSLSDNKKINFNKSNDVGLGMSSTAATKINDDFNRLFRPMPIRYHPNATPFTGKNKFNRIVFIALIKSE